MNRQCGACDGVMSIRERYSALGVPFVYRNRCSDCGTKMDLYSKAGEWTMTFFAVAMPLLVALLPSRRFESDSDRLWILLFLAVQGIVVGALVVRGRRASRRNPLVAQNGSASLAPRRGDNARRRHP